VNTDTQISAPPRDVEFQIKRWLPVLGGVILAVAAGYWIGNSDWTPLNRLSTVVVVCMVAFGLQERGWILIPSLWFVTGSIAVLPVPFAYRDLGILLAAAAYVAHRCMVKTQPVKWGHPLDYLVALNVMWALVTWLRHPVGLLIFQSEMVGARIYFNIVLATIAAWILVQQPRSSAQVRRLPYYLLIGSLVPGVLSLIIFALPSAEPLLVMLHREQLDIREIYQQEVVRFRSLAPFGVVLMLILLSRHRLGDLCNPLRGRFWLFLFSLLCQLISGYRIAAGRIIGDVAMAAWFKGGLRQLLGITLVLSLVLGAVVAGQGRLYSLPLPVQRALSFLPGKWSPVAVADVGEDVFGGGREGRFRWWKDVVKYNLIEDWWFGDGIGVRLSEMGIVSEIGRYNFTHIAEFYGMWHNGPITTIRSVGLVGLGLLLTLMGVTCRSAWQCLKKARGTPFEWLAIYLLIESVWHPLCFVVLFGDYGTDMPELIFRAALVRLLARMINETTAETSAKTV